MVIPNKAAPAATNSWLLKKTSGSASDKIQLISIVSPSIMWNR